MEIDYYSRPEISNSDILAFEKGPEYFWLYKNKKIPKMESKAMSDGSLKHMFVLEREKFWESYFANDERLSAKQKEFLQAVYDEYQRSGYIAEEMLEYAFENTYATYKKGDGMRLGSKLHDQLNGILSGKKPLSWSEINMCKDAQSIIDSNKTARESLNPSINGAISLSEVEVYFNLHGVDCRGKIDRLNIFQDQKMLDVVDLKTTQDIMSEKDILKKFEDLKYVRALEFYKTGVLSDRDLQETFGIDQSWTVNAMIVHVDRCSARTFVLSEETLKKQDQSIKDALLEIKKRQEEDVWVKEEIIKL